jgi:hypothetical protein
VQALSRAFITEEEESIGEGIEQARSGGNRDPLLVIRLPWLSGNEFVEHKSASAGLRVPQDLGC